MTFETVVEKVQFAITELIRIISEFFKKFDIRPNYEKTDKWEETFSHEAE